MSGLTYQIAHEVFNYDPVTGKLFWKKELPRHLYSSDKAWNVVNTLYAGTEACNVNKTTKYFQVVFQKKLYQVHRVIWLMTHGSWPVDQIDHDDRNRQHNRLHNLKEATHASNMLNRSDTTSGYPNIGFRPNRRSPWRVTITANGIDLPCKSFLELQDAIAYRDATRAQYNLPAI